MRRSYLSGAVIAALVLGGCASSTGVGETVSPLSDGGPQQESGAGGTGGFSHEAGPDAPKDAAPEAAAGTGGGDSSAPDAQSDTAQPQEAGSEAAPDAGGQGCIQGSFSPYYGNLHAHTSYSDGEKTPQDAFAWARDQAGLDIMAVTDHLEQVMIPTRWSDCKAAANAANAPGSFVALCGFEYATFSTPPISTGHNNVFFSDGLMNPTNYDVSDVYDSLAACPTCIGQFNHPGDDATQTWNNFDFVAAVDDRLTLFEFNGGGPVWDLYFQALQQGWHVSPMNDQDNHSADWGTKNDHRSGFFLASLDRSSLWDAMKHRRTFQTLDKNASIRLMAGDCWMGSILKGYGQVAFECGATDPDSSDGFATIELFGPGKQLLGSVDCQGQQSCQLSGVSVDSSAVAFVVARATQLDGDQLVAAPIWLE